MFNFFPRSNFYSINVIFGTWWDDVLSGTDGQDLVWGGFGDDVITTGGASDYIFASVGDDVIDAGAGNDFISGGLGFDTALYSGSIDDYTIETDSGLWGRATKISANDGSEKDALSGVEAVYFEADDYTYYLDGRNNEIRAGEDAIASGDDGLVVDAATLLENDKDYDGDTLTISEVSATSEAGATVGFENGQVSYNPGNVFDSLREGETAQDTFTYTVTDGNGSTKEVTVTVTVTGTNQAPVLSVASDVTVAENTTDVATATASDVDNTDLSYSVSGTDSDLFEIDSETGQLSFKTAPDFEAPADADGDNVYQVEVTVTDADGGTDTQNVAVTVTDENESQRDVIAFDMVDSQNMGLVNFTNTAPDFSSAGDGFGKYTADSAPYSIVDSTAGSYEGDTLGIIDETTNTGEFFGVTDSINADNTEALTASWTFDIAGYNDLGLSLDLGAMGDFESTDTFVIRYSIDGGEEQVLYSFTSDDDASQTYTLANGSTVDLDDPLVETSSGVVLTNELQTLVSELEGTGSELTITVEGVADGGSEAFAMQNLKILGNPAIVRETFAFDMVGSQSERLLEFTNSAPDFSSPADGFGKFAVGGTAPFALLDDTTTYPDDNVGVIDSSTNTDEFFGMADTVNGDNVDPLVASWRFDISDYSNISLSLDVGAMGDFESDDIVSIRYSIDGGEEQVLYSFTSDDDASKTYTLASGKTVDIDDPMVETSSGLVLSNELQTLVANLEGTGSELTIIVEGTANGSDEAFVLQNMQLEGDTTGGGGTSTTYAIAAETDAQAEGDSGTTTFEFTVTRDGDLSEAGTVDYTVGGDVDAADFGGTLPAGSIEFAAGEVAKTITVNITGDVTTELSEALTVTLSNATGGRITTGNATSTVINDDINVTLISTIQGEGSESDMVGDFVYVSALVTKVTSSGFYLQEEASDSDGNSATSEGVFVYTGSAPTVAVGDEVSLGATVTEYGGLTELTNVSDLVVLSSGNELPEYTQVTLPLASQEVLESLEGMRISVSSGNDEALTVIENFNFDRHGQITVSAGNQYQATHLYDPQDELDQVIEHAEMNQNNRILIDDGSSVENPDEFTYVPVTEENGDNGNGYLDSGDDFSEGATLRLGAEIDAPIEGVLTDGYDGHTLVVDGQISIDQSTNTDARPETPADVGGNLTVSSFNVLNYFTTLGDRGASSEEDLARQTAKIVEAMLEIDADVFGLQELENNGFDDASAIQALVDALNAELIAQDRADELYTFVNPTDGELIGTDSITTGMIYRPSKLTIVETETYVFDEASAAETYAIAERLQEYADRDYVGDYQRNRPSVATTFEDENGELFTLAVSHLKSKGPSGLSDLAEDIQAKLDAGTIPADDVAQVQADLDALLADPNYDQGDGQGFWAQVREDAAAELHSWLETDYAGAGLDPDILVIGDLNTYAQGDSVQEFVEGGDMTDLLSEYLGEEAYSYVYDGQRGSLDHALATDSLAEQVTGLTEWHINADEPDLLSYDSEFTDEGYYTDDAYAASDHDPLIIGLDLGSNNDMLV
ncbi:Endonuclease/Exonuclease/phosphatase family protein [Pseudovibrio axinellae]|uniref:Endonuclease/Exonuclease/phosphatase family protein n=1 Tax=Pseudovibrio axinellae TaxID=989403 RepID=A0A165SY00_9HYPH|nr:ExeM/NucH family extracellular endonuclease [Pseudovibrio axinellae]KZL05007.1 Endonuclease/Exonuclease/phosphatase family protein [Pseudovibrio axinellae]SER64572.1 hypothetical protein SAMN05421798_11511 [Pseudovibrio axinellae]